jgi:nitrite reductase (NADH) large subunit
VLADHLTGTNPTSAYLGSKTMTKLKVMGIDLAVMGVKEPGEGDELVQYAEPARGVYTQAIVRDGFLVGATVLGTTSRVSFLTQAFDKETPLPENRAALLFEFGSAMEEISAVDLHDDAQICNCNAVSKATILRCIEGGVGSASEVMQATRAGTGCGSCVRQVCELFDASAVLTTVG